MTSASTPPSSTPALRVALLGTGAMGAGMARNLAAAGHDTTVWNRTRERAEPLGDVARVCDDAAEAVRGADVVVTMLFDTEATAEVVGGLELGSAVWVQTATVGVEGEARLRALAEQKGVPYLDAPVLGTRKPAEDGTLVVLASGDEALRPRVDPVLDAIGQRTLWAGPAGAGSRLKLAANAWVLTTVEGVAESLALTRELGLDPALFLEAVQGSAVASPYVGLKGRAMLEGDLDPSFALSGAAKDAALVIAAAQGVGLELGLMPGVLAHLQRAVDAGHGDADMAATYLAH